MFFNVLEYRKMAASTSASTSESGAPPVLTQIVIGTKLTKVVCKKLKLFGKKSNASIDCCKIAKVGEFFLPEILNQQVVVLGSEPENRSGIFDVEKTEIVVIELNGEEFERRIRNPEFLTKFQRKSNEFDGKFLVLKWILRLFFIQKSQRLRILRKFQDFVRNWHWVAIVPHDPCACSKLDENSLENQK